MYVPCHSGLFSPVPVVDLSLEAIANAYSDYSEDKDLSLESIMTRNGALDVISPYRPQPQPQQQQLQQQQTSPQAKTPPQKSSSNNGASGHHHPALPPKPSKQKLELLLKVVLVRTKKLYFPHHTRSRSHV